MALKVRHMLAECATLQRCQFISSMHEPQNYIVRASRDNVTCWKLCDNYNYIASSNGNVNNKERKNQNNTCSDSLNDVGAYTCFTVSRHLILSGHLSE